MRSTSSTFGLLFGKHLPRAFGSWLITARPGPRARPRLRLASERRGGRSVSASVARGARDGFCCCAGRGVGPRRARCGVVPAFHTEGTHAAAPVLGRGPLPRVGLTTNQLEDRRWPTRTLSLSTLWRCASSCNFNNFGVLAFFRGCFRSLCLCRGAFGQLLAFGSHSLLDVTTLSSATTCPVLLPCDPVTAL